jgi:hypothetical protein
MHNSAEVFTIERGSGAAASAIQPISMPVPVAARVIGCSVRYAWDLVGTGQLDSFKIGGRRLVRYQDAKAYVDRLVDEERELRQRVGATN